MELGIWSKSDATFPRNEKEWMIWTLDGMIRSSRARAEYYRNHDALLGPLDTYHPTAIENRDLYRMIIVDLIFATIRSIEAFFGVLSVCWRISAGHETKKSVEKLHRRLLYPGSNTLKEVKERLASVEVDRDTLCGLCGFPIPENLNIDRKKQKALWEVYDQTLKRVKVYGKFALRYLAEYKNFRDAYAHNMRILFLEVANTSDSEPEEADILGVMDPETRRPRDIILVSKAQRESMAELTLRLCQVEQLLYENIEFYIWNDCAAMPPVAAFHIPERLQDTLVEIKRELQLNWQIPAFRVEIRASQLLERQYGLHKDFKRQVNKLGSRK